MRISVLGPSPANIRPGTSFRSILRMRRLTSILTGSALAYFSRSRRWASEIWGCCATADMVSNYKSKTPDSIKKFNRRSALPLSSLFVHGQGEQGQHVLANGPGRLLQHSHAHKRTKPQNHHGRRRRRRHPRQLQGPAHRPHRGPPRWRCARHRGHHEHAQSHRRH